jgi:hypothetical protein
MRSDPTDAMRCDAMRVRQENRNMSVSVQESNRAIKKVCGLGPVRVLGACLDLQQRGARERPSPGQKEVEPATRRAQNGPHEKIVEWATHKSL